MSRRDLSRPSHRPITASESTSGRCESCAWAGVGSKTPTCKGRLVQQVRAKGISHDLCTKRPWRMWGCGTHCWGRGLVGNRRQSRYRCTGGDGRGGRRDGNGNWEDGDVCNPQEDDVWSWAPFYPAMMKTIKRRVAFCVCISMDFASVMTLVTDTDTDFKWSARTFWKVKHIIDHWIARLEFLEPFHPPFDLVHSCFPLLPWSLEWQTNRPKRWYKRGRMHIPKLFCWCIFFLSKLNSGISMRSRSEHTYRTWAYNFASAGCFCVFAWVAVTLGSAFNGMQLMSALRQLLPVLCHFALVFPNPFCFPLWSQLYLKKQKWGRLTL